MSLASIALAALAGVLSTLSPCVLPLIPLTLGAAVGEHRYGPVAPATGLAVSFVVVGLFIAAIGPPHALHRDHRPSQRSDVRSRVTVARAVRRIRKVGSIMRSLPTYR